MIAFREGFVKPVPLMAAVLLILAFVGSGPSLVSGKDSEKMSDRPFFRYIGPNGTPVFTDDPSRIPAEYPSSATAVELPPLIQMPEPPPRMKPPPPPFSSRLQAWFQSQPAEYRMLIVGIIPVMGLSLWVLSFIRKRTDSILIKMSLRMGMMAILVLSAYLCYFMIIRIHAAKLIGSVPGGSEFIVSPKQKAEDLKKDEADRLQTIENIADHK